MAVPCRKSNNIILALISIASLHSKHCISELPLKGGAHTRCVAAVTEIQRFECRDVIELRDGIQKKIECNYATVYRPQ